MEAIYIYIASLADTNTFITPATSRTGNMLYEPEWIWLSSTPYSYFSKRFVIYSDVTWASWCLRSLTICLDQASNIENIKVLHCKVQNKNSCNEINSNSMTFCEILLGILNHGIWSVKTTTGKKLHIILFNFALKCCKVQIHITGCFTRSWLSNDIFNGRKGLFEIWYERRIQLLAANFIVFI